MAKQIKLWRHGDVVLTAVESRPTEAKEIKELVLAYGEVTGHAHRVKGNASLWEFGGERFLVVEDEATLTHEEHKSIELDRGVYRVTIQREYEPDGWRNVQD